MTPLVRVSPILFALGAGAAESPLPPFSEQKIPLPELSLSAALSEARSNPKRIVGGNQPPEVTPPAFPAPRLVPETPAQTLQRVAPAPPKPRVSREQGMPVIEPRADVDYAMTIIEPRPDIDPKMILQLPPPKPRAK